MTDAGHDGTGSNQKTAVIDFAVIGKTSAGHHARSNDEIESLIRQPEVFSVIVHTVRPADTVLIQTAIKPVCSSDDGALNSF